VHARKSGKGPISSVGGGEGEGEGEGEATDIRGRQRKEYAELSSSIHSFLGASRVASLLPLNMAFGILE